MGVERIAEFCFFCACNRVFFNGITVHYCTFPNGRIPQHFWTESILTARNLDKKEENDGLIKN